MVDLLLERFWEKVEVITNGSQEYITEKDFTVNNLLKPFIIDLIMNNETYKKVVQYYIIKHNYTVEHANEIAQKIVEDQMRLKKIV